MTTRVYDFTRINPLKVHWSELDEDPEEFIDGIQIIVNIMDYRARMSKSDSNISYMVMKKYRIAILIKEMDISSQPVMPTGYLNSGTHTTLYICFVKQDQGLDTRADLELLDMFDFDSIMGKDWLAPHQVVLDCYAKTITLAIPVCDISAKAPPISSVTVAYEFLDVFSTDLHGLPLERDVDIAIEVEPGNKPIFIPPYRMASVELKELSVQFQVLLD
ncbi:uncharacterized protein LOC129872229 [Solanum dulcamara]|uniref:uncharacterized protein LOC129872229 n=1 Tax=Solanum dulcamara TaxID=45834 RepID=UPI002486AC60|nr:uncharacterized protein LOC129872229 [Solanum dulcamara]